MKLAELSNRNENTLTNIITNEHTNTLTEHLNQTANIEVLSSTIQPIQSDYQLIFGGSNEPAEALQNNNFTVDPLPQYVSQGLTELKSHMESKYN